MTDKIDYGYLDDTYERLFDFMWKRFHDRAKRLRDINLELGRIESKVIKGDHLRYGIYFNAIPGASVDDAKPRRWLPSFLRSVLPIDPDVEIKVFREPVADAVIWKAVFTIFK